jgi:prepilin-type N-terminal cleavage/methylation domain-containing protein
MARKDYRGFTLIELLTVIAIIALLVALLFPVYGRMRESARQRTCMSNMHDIYVAMSLYKQDQGEYPAMLLGPAERADGLPWVLGDSQPPVLASQIKRGFLYPTYVRSIETFRCPNNPVTNQQVTTTASFSSTSPWNAFLVGATGHDYPLFDPALGGFGFKSLPSSYASVPISFYAYDSYDTTAAIGADGKRTPGPLGGPGYLIAYTRDWTRGGGAADAPNQLKYSNPPPDKTILTWCNYHVAVAGADICPMILASGTARSTNYKLLLDKGWNVAGQ